MRALLKTLASAVLVLFQLLILFWVVQDFWRDTRQGAAWARLTIAVLLLICAGIALLRLLSRSMLGRASAGEVARGIMTTLGVATLLVAGAWVVWQVFWLIHASSWRRLADRIVSPFSTRIGFWLLLLLLVTLSVIVLSYLATAFRHAGSGIRKRLRNKL